MNTLLNRIIENPRFRFKKWGLLDSDHGYLWIWVSTFKSIATSLTYQSF
jgi:hypothetical protein